jgi:predicted nucleic acid-binding Zn ribbon protein
MIKKIGDILRGYLLERGWSGNNPYSSVFLRWEEIAGEELSRHARPIEIEDGILIVEADHPGWVQMVSLRKDGLLRSISDAAPSAEIKDVRVKLSRGGGRGG